MNSCSTSAGAFVPSASCLRVKHAVPAASHSAGKPIRAMRSRLALLPSLSNYAADAALHICNGVTLR